MLPFLFTFQIQKIILPDPEGLKQQEGKIVAVEKGKRTQCTYSCNKNKDIKS